MKDRVLRDFTPEDIRKIADTFHAWKKRRGLRRRTPGFCKAVRLEDIRKHDFVLTPGRYVGAAEQEADGEAFEEKMARLMTQLDEQFGESARLEKMIRENLERLGYGR